MLFATTLMLWTTIQPLTFSHTPTQNIEAISTSNPSPWQSIISSAVWSSRR